MKSKKIFVLLSALALSLAACGGKGGDKTSSDAGGNPSSSSQSDTVAVTAVAINKTSLTLEPGASETLTASVTPNNASDTSVTWSSSDTSVATVSALGKVSALKAGTAKIIATSVSNPDVKGECSLTVQEQTAKELYGTTHKGTEDDPLTNEDAIIVAKHKDVGTTATAKEYYIKGEVDYFQELPNSNGNVSFTFKPAEGKNERFVAYRVKKGADLDAVSFDDVWKGGQATIKAKIVNYKGTTPETAEANKGILVKCEGTKVAPQTITGKTVAEATAAVNALHDNESTFDKYEVTGYIIYVDSIGTFFMSDTKGAVNAKPGAEVFEVYQYAGENKNDCTINAKVKVTCALKKYVSTSSEATQVETGAVYNVEILEEGDEAPIVVKGATPLKAVAKDTEYYAGINQATINKNCFLTGAASGTFLATGSFANAKEVILEEATGGYNLKFKGGKYVNMNDSQKVALGDAASTVYSWDSVTNSVTATSGNDKYYLCAYSTYETLGFSKESYVVENGKVKAGQFPLQFYAIEAKVAPTEIQISQRATVEAEQTVTLDLRYNPYNADVSQLTWSSSAEAVATVNKGVVTGVSAGTAVITAAVGDVKDTCTVTVTAPVVSIVDLPADGLSIDSAALDLANNSTYAKNNNRAVTVNGVKLTLDPKSEGSITKASAPYTAAADKLGVDCMQFKKGNLVGFKTTDKIKAAKKATVEMYVSGYATEGKDYLPYFLLGSSTTPVLANETNGGTANASGVDTGKKDGEKVLYKYTLTYDLSSLDSGYVTFVTAKSGACYIGNITIDNNVEIAQPKGKFFAAAELGEGKSALGITANIAPIFIELGDNNAVTVNFNAMELAATIKSYDKATGNLVITAAQVGDVSMTWNPETACLEKLAIAAAPTLLKWNGGQSLKGNDQLKHWSMDGTDSELQAQFDRRYGSSSWTKDETNANRIVSEETAKRGKAARVLKDPSKRYSLATKDFSAKFKAKNLSFWVYNDGEAAVKIQIFGYKSTGWTNFFEIQSDKEIQPGWTFFSRGFTETEMYGFQIIAKTDAVSMVYDDICLF